MKRYFEKLPGTGVIFNSIVMDDKGQIAFYIPVVTYSCPPNTWMKYCSDVSMLKRFLTILLVLHSAVMTLNLLVPNLIESILNGMIYGALITLMMLNTHNYGMANFDIFLTTVFGGLFMSAFFGTASLYFNVGVYLTKLTFSNLLMAIVMETCFYNTISPYLQFFGALSASIALKQIKISFSVLNGGFMLIMGLSYLLKVGNLHRILVNNFYAITSVYKYSPTSKGVSSQWAFIRPNFINYEIELNSVDYWLLLTYAIGAVLLTIRKEKYFCEHPNLMEADHLFSSADNVEEFNRNVARRRKRNNVVGIRRLPNGNQLRIVSRYRPRHQFRSNILNEHTPLISHWLASSETELDDDVFESPESNSRYMRTLSSGSRERVNAIQQFQPDREVICGSFPKITITEH